ncbi:HyaD/HybD family hydrogenase maturation endopeptidase [Hydrogenimonas sp.]
MALPSTVVIGIGNILFKDEGVGVYVAKYIEENFDFYPAIDIVDGGTLGFRLMSYYQSYERVLILDTVSIKDTPGSIYNLPAKELLGLGAYRNTAHEVEVVEMLEICSMLEKIAEVSVIGMVPEDIDTVEISLSDTVKTALPAMAAEAIRELGSKGFEASVKKGKSLDSIIRSYNAPTMEALHG